MDFTSKGSEVVKWREETDKKRTFRFFFKFFFYAAVTQECETPGLYTPEHAVCVCVCEELICGAKMLSPGSCFISEVH